MANTNTDNTKKLNLDPFSWDSLLPSPIQKKIEKDCLIAEEVAKNIEEEKPSDTQEGSSQNKKASLRKLTAQNSGPTLSSDSHLHDFLSFLNKEFKGVLSANFLKEATESMLKLQNTLNKTRLNFLKKNSKYMGHLVQFLQDTTQKQIKEIQKQYKEYEEQKEKQKRLGILSTIAGALSLVFAAFMGPGALVVACTLFALDKTGAMNKMMGSISTGSKVGDVFAKIGICVALSVAVGAGAGAIDGAIGKEAIDKSGKTILTTASERFAASSRFGFVMTAINSIATTNCMGELVKACKGSENLQVILGTISTVLLCGALLAVGGNSGGVGSGLSAVANPTNVAKLQLLMQCLLVSTLAAQGYTHYELHNTSNHLAQTTEKLGQLNGNKIFTESLINAAQKASNESTNESNKESKNFETMQHNLRIAATAPWIAATGAA